jgi:2-polyprenyl-3-methyl-5-hydroxy-6-metoxy-1,4-benzoquinol methylase
MTARPGLEINNMTQTDLAGTEHWDEVYQSLAREGDPLWEPADYGSIVIARVLLEAISRANAKTIFEVGCGNSIWLPYIARKTGAEVGGLDYSEGGCELARRQLASHGVSGKIFCRDLFEVDDKSVGTYDFVYSLGMVEHFTDTTQVLAKLLELVNPGGVLFTEVPNLKSIHGLMSWVWHPKLLAKHKALGKRDLITAYRQLGIEEIEGHYAGNFSLQIVAWETDQRWPRQMRVLAPKIVKLRNALDNRLKGSGKFGGTAPFAPYVYVVGRKSI